MYASASIPGNSPPVSVLARFARLIALGVNRVLLLGHVTAAGVKISWSEGGTSCCTFTLCVEDAGKDGHTFKLFVPVEVWGKHAEWVAETLDAGVQVLIDGRLKSRLATHLWRNFVSPAFGEHLTWPALLRCPSAGSSSAAARGC